MVLHDPPDVGLRWRMNPVSFEALSVQDRFTVAVVAPAATLVTVSPLGAAGPVGTWPYRLKSLTATPSRETTARIYCDFIGNAYGFSYKGGYR